VTAAAKSNADRETDSCEDILYDLEFVRQFPIPREFVLGGLRYAAINLRVGNAACDELMDALGEHQLVEVSPVDRTMEHDNRYMWVLSPVGERILGYLHRQIRHE